MKQREANRPHLPSSRMGNVTKISTKSDSDDPPRFPVSSVLLQANSVEDVHLGEEGAVVVGLHLNNELGFIITNVASSTKVNISKPSGAYCFA